MSRNPLKGSSSFNVSGVVHEFRVELERITNMVLSGTHAIPRHHHSGYQLIYVERGDYRCRLNDTELSLSTNQALLVAPGDWHQEQLDCDDLSYFGVDIRVHSSFRSGTQNLLQPGKAASLQKLSDPPANIATLVHGINDLSDNADPLGNYLLEARTQELFWEVIRALPPEIVQAGLLAYSERDRFLLQLEQVFQGHSRSTVTLQQLAGEMAMSKRTLTSKCSEFLGRSPVKAFREFRLAQATEMLRNTDMTVKEVSAFLGFENQYHFSRVYKEFAGYPPSAERGQ